MCVCVCVGGQCLISEWRTHLICVNKKTEGFTFGTVTSQSVD